MRISSISSYNYNNYNSRNNAPKNKNQVSFGRFADERADKAFMDAANSLPTETQRFKARYVASQIRDCCFNQVYVDDRTKEGKIRVEWNEKMINGNSHVKSKPRNLDDQMIWVDDLREYPSMLLLRLRMDRITDSMLGIEPKPVVSDGPGETERERRRQQDLLNYLQLLI